MALEVDFISVLGCALRTVFDPASAGHLQSQATAVGPAQPSHSPPGSPDISLLSSQLQQQWDVNGNMHLGAVKIKPNSRIRAVWRCNKCPAGQPHIWTAYVYSRIRGTHCPYCSNRMICLHNTLATIAPDVAHYWNYSNNKTTPQQVVAYSHYRAEWQCPICKWEWQAPIFSRTHARAGCPRCSACKHHKNRQLPTFAAAQPACLAEWDYERNDEVGFYPDVVTLGSNKQVHWICSCCPKGQPHRWTAMPNRRIGLDTGCPVCAGQKACVCNSLESLYPLLAAEFDVDKNGFAPSEIPSRSNKKVWWRNARQGSWQQSPDIRNDRRNELYMQQVPLSMFAPYLGQIEFSIVTLLQP